MSETNNNIDPWLDVLNSDTTSQETDDMYLFDLIEENSQLTQDPIYGPYGLRTTPGVDVNPNREKTKISTKIPTASFMSPTTGIVMSTDDKIVETEDMYSISNIPVEYDDGTEGYISFGELNEDWNPNLAREYKEIEKEVANYNFEPYVTEGYYSRREGYTIGGGETIVPFEKELKAVKDNLIELKENSSMSDAEKIIKLQKINTDPKRADADGYISLQQELPTMESHLSPEFHFDGKEPSEELVQEYFKFNKLRTLKQEARQREIDRGLRQMSPYEQKATKLAKEKIKSVAAKNIVQDQEDFELNLKEFELNPENKKIKQFELNVLDPDYTFDIKQGEETIELNNGKVLPLATWNKYQKDITNYNIDKDKLVNTLTNLIERQETIQDADEELDLLRRNYNLADKVVFNFSTMTGDLAYGLLDLASGGDSEAAQRRRVRIEKERQTYRPDIKFKNAFDSWSNFGSFIAEETGKQAPIFGLIALSGGTASYLGAGMYASAAVSGTTLGLMTGGQQMGDMTFEEYKSMLDGLTYNDVEYSSLQKIGTGLGFGAAEGLFGTAPTFLLGRRWAKSAYSAFAKNNLDDVLKVTGTQYFKNRFLKEAGLGLVAEAPSEGLTQITQNGLTDKPLLEGVDHATFSGGFFGVVLGGGSVAIGAAGRSMMDFESKDQLDKIYTDIKNANIRLEKLDGRTTDFKIAKKQRDDLVKEAENKIEQFESTWSSKMNKSAYETYKQMIIEQAKIRNQALDINKNPNISKDIKNKQLEKLAFEFGMYQQQIDKFKDPKFYANKFEGIKVTEPERYKKIIEKAKQNLKSESLTESKLNAEAYDIYLQQEIDKRSKAADKLLKGVGRNWTKHQFKNEGEAKSYAATFLQNEKNLTKEQKKFWNEVLKADPNTLNGTAASVNGTYTYVTIDDTAKKNEREATESHEIGHLVFWDKLNVQGDQYKPLADAIEEHLKTHEPTIYNEMFGQDGTQAVEKDEKGNYIPMEVVMGLVERANRIDMSKFQNKHLMGYIGNFISKSIDSDAVDLSTNDNVVSFLVQLGKKINDGTLTKEDIAKANKNKVFQETIKLDKDADNASELENKIEETANSESTLFETTEMIGGVVLNEDGSIKEDGWTKLSEEEKIKRAQTLSLYWENFLNKKIGQQIKVDDIEQLALLNKFTGFSHNTDDSPITESYAAKRGFIDIVKRWEPTKNNSLAAWIQSANNLPMRILELSQTSKTFGRFEDRIDQEVEGFRPIEVIESSDNIDVQMDKVKNVSNKFRKLLKIEDNSDLYNKVISDVKTTLNKKEIKPLIKTNPKKLRQNLKKDFEKSLEKEISNILGTQKSDKFKKFISDKSNLQSLINLLGVKYRNRFPMFTTDGGRANVSQSKIIQQSDEGSFIKDTRAGNQIWIPKDVKEMSDQDIQNIVDDFVQGRETKYKSLKKALANELALDAVFTAMKSDPDIETQYEGTIGELSESIKRDPEAAFSRSQEIDFAKLGKEVYKQGYDAVYSKPGVLNPEFAKQFKDQYVIDIIQELQDQGLIPNEKVDLFGTQIVKFLNSIGKNKLANQVKKAVTKKSSRFLRKSLMDDTEILAAELGSQIVDVLKTGSDLQFFGFINKVLDPAKKKKSTGKPGFGYKTFQKIIKNTALQEDLPAELDLSKVRLMNITVTGGLFDKINKILKDKNLTVDQKKKKLLDKKLQDEIKDANTHNKILFKHIAKKLINSKISDANFIRILQLQTSAVRGLRALTALKYWTITGSPMINFKGEHLGPNALSMFKIAKLRFENLTNDQLDAKLDEILEFHDQWIEENSELDVVDIFSKLNPNLDERILLNPFRVSSVFSIDMTPARDAIKQRKNKIDTAKEINKSSNIRKNLQHANSKSSAKRKGISIFDFDDTLARTKSKVIVTLNGKTFKIDATRFALESADLEAAGATFDFSEFNKVVDGKKGPLADLALKRQGKFGSGDIFVLTARPAEASYAIHAFLKGIGLEIPIDNITGLEDGRPEAKADWILGKVAEGYNDFYFADDAIKNIKAVSDILKDIDVKSRVELAFSKVDPKSFKDKINQIIENQSGVRKETTFSTIVAKRRGADIGKYEFFMPPSAEDFVGLLTYLTGRGEQGTKDRSWLIDNLAKPYFRGVDAINVAKTSVKVDYSKVLNAFEGVEKKLNTLIPNGNFTYDQAVRIYIWNKQGTEIPGLSKRDIADAVKSVKQDKMLVDFANNVEKIGSTNDVYIKPEEGWDVGTILGDLNNLSNRTGRKVYLKDWLDAVEATFTPDVMNKLEAVYGTRYVEALKDIIHRMTTGTNRTTGQNRQANEWLNWINNSVGTIMFFNRKSALLQSISTINFLNWSDNSPIKAGMAWANQPQFWKDFVMIWNSPKLKQRRRGLQTDLQWQEIASAAKRGKTNKANAVISYLLKIGFTPTQLVDNFAIAAGGAPFYRNRVKTYLKEGMSRKEAETKAFEDFSDIAEETQQSGDPAYISSEQASVMGRIILNFQNTPMQMVRLQKKAGIMLVRRQRYPGMSQRQSDFTNIGKIIYYGAIQNFIFTFLQNAMFALLPGFEGDEFDDLAKQGRAEKAKKARFINNMIDTLLRGSGIKGAVLSTIKNAILRYQREEEKGFTGDHAYTLLELANVSPSIGSKFRKLYSAYNTKKYNKEVLKARGFSVAADGKLNLSPAYDITGSLTSAIFNLPLDRVVAEIDAIVEATDSRNSTWQRVALALGWRTWDIGARNEEEDLIKVLEKIKEKNRKKQERKDDLELFDN